MDDSIDRQASSTVPLGLAIYLPEEPGILLEAQAYPERLQLQGALKREMDEKSFRCIWKTVDRPKGKPTCPHDRFQEGDQQRGASGKAQIRLPSPGIPPSQGVPLQGIGIAGFDTIERSHAPLIDDSGGLGKLGAGC